jgi:hypothetical protein
MRLLDRLTAWRRGRLARTPAIPTHHSVGPDESLTIELARVQEASKNPDQP